MCGLGADLEYEDVNAGGVLPEGVLPGDGELSPARVGPVYPGEQPAVDPGLQPGDEEWLGLSHAWLSPIPPTGNSVKLENVAGAVVQVRLIFFHID